MIEGIKDCNLQNSGGYRQLVDNVMHLVEPAVMTIRETLAKEAKIPIDFDASVDISDAMYS